MIVKSSLFKYGKWLIASYVVLLLLYTAVTAIVLSLQMYCVYLAAAMLTDFILLLLLTKTVMEYQSLLSDRKKFKDVLLAYVYIDYVPLGVEVTAVCHNGSYVLKGVNRVYNKPIQDPVIDLDNKVMYIPYSHEIYFKPEIDES